eukprot:6191898-Pleurochrysis_carterae.AAC.2
MHACITAGARFVIAPCCVGKLSRKRMNNVTWNQTGSFDARLSYAPHGRVNMLLAEKSQRGARVFRLCLRGRVPTLICVKLQTTFRRWVPSLASCGHAHLILQ